MSWRDHIDKKKKKNILEDSDNKQNEQKFSRVANMKLPTKEQVQRQPVAETNQQPYLPKKDMSEMQKATSKISQQNQQSKSTWERVQEKLPNVAYVGKKTGAGLLSGVTGLAQGVLTDTANQLNKGEQKSKLQSAVDFGRKMISPSSNIAEETINAVKSNIDIIKDKDKNVFQKIAGVGTNTVSNAINMLPFKQKTNETIQAVGSALKEKNISQKVLDVNKTISKPSEDINQQLAEEGQNYGIATQYIGDAMQSVGNMIPSIATTIATGDPSAGLLAMGLSAKGTSTNEALKKGLDLDDAVKRGDTDAMIEVGTEMLTGGINIFGKGALDDLVQNGIVKNVKNEVGRFLVQQGVNVGGEVLEETISDILGTVLDKGTTDPDATYSWKDWGKTAVTTTLSTAVLNLLTGGLAGDIRQGQNRNELRNQVDSNKSLTDSQKENLNSKIQDDTITNQQELENETNKLDIIENSGLDEERKASLLRVADKNNLDLDQITSLIEADQERYGIEQNQDTTTQNNEVLQEGQQTIQEGQQVTQNETSQQPSEYTTNLMKSIDNYNNSRQEGQEIFDINNEETRKEIESIQKVAENRGINITFDENRFDNTDTNAFYEYDKDGNVANIVLNPNSTSKKYVQNLVIHEMTHSFEGSKQYNSLSKAILDYAKSKGEYDKAFNDLMNTYSKVYSGENLNKIVEKEAVANILGEKLGDKEFVDSLVNNQYVERSTIQKIIDFVKNQINRFKGYKDQEAYWNNVKTLFEDAYNKSEVSQEGLKNGELRYSIGGEKSLTANIDKLNKAKELKEEGLSTKDIYKQTGWYESIDGKWKYEIDDSNFNLKENLIEKDTTYDLEEILDAPELFEAYPKLKEISVSFDDLGDSTKGEKYSRMGFDYITLNNDLINKSASKKDYDLLGIKNQSEVYSTLMHEIQHVIQGYEGFAKGSNIDFWSNTIKDIDRKYERTQNDYQRFKDEIGLKEYEDKLLQDWKKDKITGKELTQRIDNYIEEKGYTEKFDRLAELQKELLTQKYKLEDTTPGTLYFFTAGELEAREVQNRINKDSEWRKQNLPQENGMAVFVEDFTDKITDSYSSKTTTDSQGRELSKGQQEYFKNVSPELKDENGNLKRFYHGTNSDFTVFDLSKGGQSNSGASIGFWFTETKEGAEKFANDVWYGDKKPNTKEVYLDIKNPKIYENVKNEEQEQFYKDKSEELEKKAKELRKKYSWDKTDYKTSMTFDSLIRDYHYARIKNENVDLDMFERLAEGRGFSKEQISEMKNDAKEYDKTIAESKEAENEYYKLHYNDAYEQFKIDLYEVAGQSAEEANTGGLGMALNNPKETVEKFRQKLIAEGYDGIIIKGTQFDKGNFNGENNQYVIFNSNQAKNIDNTNPTTSPDIRYSQDTTGAWNNFIEKYFKNEGDGTAIKDLKKLPERKYTIQDYEEVINNSANIPEADKTAILKDLEGIELNKQSLNDFKQEIERLDKKYAEEQQRFDKKDYKDKNRANLILEKNREFFESENYDNSIVKKLDKEAYRTKKGNRTVPEWLNMAKQLGQRIANLSPEQIEDIAIKSYLELEPTKHITKYDARAMKYIGLGKESLYQNDWVNEVYEGVRENRQFSVETENQENIEQPTQEEIELPKAKKILNPTEISNLKPEDMKTTPELPNKKYKKGSKESSFISNINNDVGFLTKEQKQDILKDENVKYYAPVTNADSLAKAFDNLNENGQNATYEWYAKPTENATAEDVATGWILLKQYADEGNTQGMVNVAKKLRDMGTKAGQTVQAFNILSRLTPEGMVAYTQRELTDAYEEMIKGKSKKWIDQHKGDFDLSQDEIAFIMDTMQNLPESNPANNDYERKVELGKIQKLFTDKMPAEGGKIKSWMRISMLFNPKTQVRNVMGNAVVIPVNMTSDFLGSKVDKVLSKYTGIRTLGNPNAKAYLKGMKEGFYQSYNDFRLGINTRDIEQNKFEFGQGKTFKDKGIGKALNRVDNLLNFVMDFGDRGFSQASFVNSLNNQMLLNGVTTPTQEMIDIATNESLSRTWNDDNDYTRFVLNIRKGLNKIGGKNYGLGDVLIPFAKTPANLTKAIVNYSPIGLTKSILDIKGIKNAIETGQITAKQQHQFADNLGKGLAGTMLYVLGYALANAGVTTGEPDEDKDVKNFMKNSLGISPYSIKIGDKTFTYDWAQPIATPFAITSNLYKTNKDNPDASMIEKIMNATNIGTNQLMEQSFMESLNEVLNGNGTITERLQKAMLDLPARAIPTFSKQIADMVDGTQRTSFEYGKPIQSAINSAKAKLPFVSKELTPVVDTLGNEVQKYGGENNMFNVFLNPANMNKGERTKAGEEIYNIYEQTGDTTIFPVTAPYYINYNGAKITMDSEQRAEYQKTTGNYAEEMINDLLKDKNYTNLSDTDKAEILSQIVKDSNEKAKRDILNIENKSSDLGLIDKIGSDYYDYKIVSKNDDSQTDKFKTLLDNKYSNKNKQLIFDSEIKKKDSIFDGLMELNKNLNMDSYLNFKLQDFSGTNKKNDTINYLKNSDFSREEQLYIQGKIYKLNNAERSELESLLRNKLPSENIVSILQSIK